MSSYDEKVIARADRVIAKAERLSASDNSLSARQLRETAASQRDHRSAALRRQEWARQDRVNGNGKRL